MSVRVSGWTCTHDRCVASAIDGVTGEVVTERLVPDPEVVIAWIGQASRSGGGDLRGRSDRVRSVPGVDRGRYRLRRRSALEADPPAGDRVKTDANDAVLLARLLRLGEITEVVVPDRRPGVGP